jgi:glycosyltransferase involved in cell wall biosynthesis
MKIIINTSNLYVGGGVQVALSFISELKIMNFKNEYHIFLSQAVDKQINQDTFDDRFYFYLIEKSPSSLRTRRKIVLQLNDLEEKIKPDIVFSIFGPTYWTPKTKHIMGFAVPWLLQQDSPAYRELNFLKRIKMRLWVKYISYFTKRNASKYIIETEDGKNKFSNVMNINKNNIFVVGNSYSSVFSNPIYLKRENENFITLPDKQDDEFRLLLISHNHPHKNLKIINKVLTFLDEINVKFVLTIDEESYKKLFNVKVDKIINLGPIPQKSCPSVYKQCDALFLPTLLEVFSASYPEAMKMQKPILTSNYSFAIDICRDAALYFDPLDPEEIASKIKQLINNKKLQKELIEKGNKRLKEFETAQSRAEKYIDICKNL